VEDRIHAAAAMPTIAPLDLIDGDSIARLATAISAGAGGAGRAGA